jgi:inositol transport system permease protein
MDIVTNGKKIFTKYGIIFVLLFLILIMGILISGFFTPANITGIAIQSSIYGIMALGMTFIILSGGIDLAAGSIVAIAAVICAGFGQTMNAPVKLFSGLPEMNVAVSIIVALVVGAFCGLINGLLITKGKLFPFIATLGTYTLMRGLALSITKGSPINRLVSGFRLIGGNLFGFFPVPVLIFLIMFLLCTIILNYTRFGANVFTVGGNRVAAQVTGINVQQVLIGVYVLAGFLYGVSAFVFAGRVLSVNPGAAEGYELKAISATVIGGTSPVGARATIWGAVVGALILAVIENGLTLMAVNAYWQQVIQGMIIIIAVVFVIQQKGRS